MGGADGHPEAGGDAGEGVMTMQVPGCGEHPLVRRELATAVTGSPDDEVTCPSTMAHEDHSARASQPGTSMRCVPMTDSSRSASWLRVVP